jgi:hypothetical protein
MLTRFGKQGTNRVVCAQLLLYISAALVGLSLLAQTSCTQILKKSADSSSSSYVKLPTRLLGKGYDALTNRYLDWPCIELTPESVTTTTLSLGEFEVSPIQRRLRLFSIVRSFRNC